MIRNGSGIVCLSLMPEHLKKLNINLMVPTEKNESPRATSFTVSIEAKEGITTGVSSADRAHTILTAVSDSVTSHDIVTPGHIFPLQAKNGGVLEREGHTEGAIDLVKLAGFKPAAVICELMNSDGTMLRGDALKSFAEKNKIKIVSSGIC